MSPTTRGKHLLCFFLVYLCAFHARCQQISAPEAQRASISGVVTDIDGGLIPGATVVANGSLPKQHQSATADTTGAFTVTGLAPAVSYRLTISAKGFADYTSAAVVLTPGQHMELPPIKLQVASAETTVSAASVEELATEQVHAEEQQRILGVIPNFYVVYGNQFVPLTPKLKFKLAFRASTDVVTFAGTAFISGINQAADTPAYQQGWKGYGQRFGAVYASSFSDIMIGGALLPSVLHQDPRYFYQGTGTKKSRAIHALEAPFVAKGDNGRWQPNYSSVIGDFSSAALATTYSPPQDRTASAVIGNALVTTVGRIANTLVQEFLLSKFTSGSNTGP